MGCVISGNELAFAGVWEDEDIPSLGMVRMGICVMDPLRPSTRPARSYIVDKSVYI